MSRWQGTLRMTYTFRLVFIAALLAVATVGASSLTSRPTDVLVVAQAPNGVNVASTSTITVTFSRMPDPRSAELAFALYPPVQGRFICNGITLTFQPSVPMRSKTMYHVHVRRGLLDEQGHSNKTEVQWPFRTR